MPCGRTSMPGLQATDLLATLLACSGRRHNQLCRLSHECKLGDQTKDDADKELVKNEAELLRERVKWLIIEIHPEIVGSDVAMSMLSNLSNLGFDIRQTMRGNVFAIENMML